VAGLATGSSGRAARLPRFAPLRHRNFALFWFASIVSNSGSWMQNVAQGLLVYNLTSSPFLLGLVAFARAVPLLVLPLIGGVVADRIPRLRLLKVTQTISLALAVTLGLLVATGLVRVWEIVLFSFLSGVVSSFDQPTQQALLPDLVPSEALPGAIALYSSSWQSAALFGPALAGAIIPFVSLAGVFYINAASYLAVIVALFLLTGVPERAAGGHQRSMRHDLTAGLRYVRSTPLVGTLIMLAALTNLFGRGYQYLLPVFARDVLRVGVLGLGLMTSAPGAGALAGALLVASAGSIAHKGRVLFTAMLAFTVLLVVASFSRQLELTLAALFGVGLTFIVFSSMLTTMLQLTIVAEMRGRVLSLLTVVQQGFNPFGGLFAGAVATLTGTPNAVALGAVVVAVGGLVTLATAPGVRRFAAPAFGADRVKAPAKGAD
jgi:MFS family permease